MTERHALPSRVAMSIFAGLIIALVPASATFADAPGPTDYRSTITSVETTDGLPLPEGVSISIEGHDSFLALTVPKGVAAEVPGYEGESYLKIDQDCTTSENQHSMSTWYNKDRFGGDASTDLVDNDANPDWKIIGSTCSVAWHDHRIHYMSSIPPINAEPGDVIVTDSIALTIDGRDVVVYVASELVAPASQLPAIVGAIVAFAIVTVMWRGTTLALLVFPISAIGIIIGGAQYLWAPADTAVPLGARRYRAQHQRLRSSIHRCGSWYCRICSPTKRALVRQWIGLARWHNAHDLGNSSDRRVQLCAATNITSLLG